MNEQKSENENFYHLTHDTFFKEMFQMRNLAIAFLRKFLSQETLKRLDLKNLTIETEDFKDEFFHETRPDMVYRVPIIGRKESVSVHVIIEHKSYNDRETIFQIWKYVHQLCIKDVEIRLTDSETKKRRTWPKNFRISPIIPIVLHHGATPFSGEVELSKLFYQLPGAEEFLPHQKAYLIDLSTIKEEEIPRDANVPELHIVLLIMKTIFEKNRVTLNEKLGEIFEELKPFSDIPMYREIIRYFWHYTLNNVRKLTKTDIQKLETKIREITGEKTMPTVVQRYYQKGIAKGFAEGEAKGKAEGEAKGKAEGKVQGKAEALLRILTKRFRSVPKSLEKRILAITDLERLDQLADFAFDCESLPKFTAAMK